MIRYLKVEGLNNKLDAEFEFNEDLNIFTGANGSGKTTLLKLIWYLISGNLQIIMYEIPFKFISIRTDFFNLTTTRVKSDRFKFDCQFVQKNVDSLMNVVVNPDLKLGTAEDASNVKKFFEMNNHVANVMKRSFFFPTFRRIESELFSLSNISYFTGDLRKRSEYHPSLVPGRLQAALSEFSSVMSVEAHQFITSISTQDIVRLLDRKQIDISGEINDLHTTLSDTIIEKIETLSHNEEQTNVGKSQDAISLLDDIQNIVKQVDCKRKDLLTPFTVLTNLIQEMLNYQSLNLKEETLSNEGIEGIKLDSGKDGLIVAGAREIEMSSGKLSSGEKQMLSFLCYNVFYNNIPIFIDEPELSLHVDWQRRLFPTLMEQGQNNQFFVATHSPFIYTKYPDKEFMLDEDRGES